MPPPLPFDPITEAARQWSKHWGEQTTPPMRAVTSIMRAHQILMSRLNEALAPYNLTFPRYEALMLLYYSRTGSLPLGKMGDRLQVHRTSVTNLMDGLEREGLAAALAAPDRPPHDAGDDHAPRSRSRQEGDPRAQPGRVRHRPDARARPRPDQRQAHEPSPRRR